jgi:hypothetical protein
VEGWKQERPLLRTMGSRWWASTTMSIGGRAYDGRAKESPANGVKPKAEGSLVHVS